MIRDYESQMQSDNKANSVQLNMQLLTGTEFGKGLKSRGKMPRFSLVVNTIVCTSELVPVPQRGVIW